MLRLKFEHSPYKLGGGHCRFEKLWGKFSLNATLNGRSHYNKSPEPLIWGLFDHSPSESYLSLSHFFLPIFVALLLCLSLSHLFLFPSLSLSLSSMLKTNRTLSKHFAQPLVLLHLPHYCRVQKCSMIPLSGLFENISDLRQGCHWQWTRKNYEKMMMGLTSLEIGRTEW